MVESGPGVLYNKHELLLNAKKELYRRIATASAVPEIVVGQPGLLNADPIQRKLLQFAYTLSPLSSKVIVVALQLAQ